MNRTIPVLLLTILCLAAATPARASTAAPKDPIAVQFPKEGQTLPTLSAVNFRGSVADPSAPLTVNGRPVKVHRTGGFLGYVPVSTGTVELRFEQKLDGGTVSFVRTFTVTPPPERLPPGPARIDPASVEPSSDLELAPGDWLQVSFRGTPGHEAQCQLGSRGGAYPMVEAAPGLYRGSARILAGDLAGDRSVRVTLRDRDGGRDSAVSAGKAVLLSGSPVVVAVKTSEAVKVRSGPGLGTIMFPPAGTRFLAGGEAGGQVRLVLAPGFDGWAAPEHLEVLPHGTLPPGAVLHTIRTEAGEGATAVYLGLTDKVPFIVEPTRDLDGVVVRLFSTRADTDWMVYDSDDFFVKGVRWSQEAEHVTAVSVDLGSRRRVWGWDASWEEGALRLELRHPPRIRSEGSVFRGLRIIVDPGHSPSSPGAIGPTGVREVDINDRIAESLVGYLEGEGAKVLLTRPKGGEASLEDRAAFAKKERGDLFVSIHNNNLNPALDPFAYEHGFSVFYYHPQSLELARSVHRAFQRRIGLPDEKLRYGNLSMARIAQMPSALVECAYLTYPSQEEHLSKPDFRRLLADTILEGLRGFLSRERARQARVPRVSMVPRPQPMSGFQAAPKPKPKPVARTEKKPDGAKGKTPTKSLP